MIRFVWITFLFLWLGCSPAHTTTDHTLQAVIELAALNCSLAEIEIINRTGTGADEDQKAIDRIRKTCDQGFAKLAKITGQVDE